MKCAYHPEIDAVALCDNCGRPLCERCQRRRGLLSRCPECAQRQSKARTAAPAAKQPAPHAGSNSASSTHVSQRNLSFFDRHLNWTIILGCYLPALTLCLFPITCFTSIIICGWVLKKKSRSLEWLDIASIPFVGWSVPISLENRTEAMSTATQEEDPTLSVLRAASTEGKRESDTPLVLIGLTIACAALGALFSSAFYYSLFSIGHYSSHGHIYLIGVLLGVIRLLGELTLFVPFVTGIPLLAGLISGIAALVLMVRHRNGFSGAWRWGLLGTISCAAIPATDILLYLWLPTW